MTIKGTGMIDIIKEKWNEILEFMRTEFDMQEVSYNTWLKPLKPLQYDDGKLYIWASDNPTVVGIVRKKYRDYLAVAISKVTNIDAEPEFLSENEVAQLSQRKGKEPQSTDPYTDAVKKARLNPRYTFESFVSGKFNELAHAAALAVAEAPGEDYRILYIYGGVGLGKTHLMQAIAHYILRRNPNTNILYVSSETFTNDFIDSIKNRSKSDSQSETGFRKKYRQDPDVLLIDDIQFIANKPGTQEEFFHTFNALYENNKQIVITSDKPPKDINNLEERIRSRFEGGLVVDIQIPDYETRVAILRKKEEEEDCLIDDEVIKYIAENIRSNIRILEGALKKLILRARLSQKPIDVEMAKEILKDMTEVRSGPGEVTPQKVINIVCEHYMIDEKEFLSKKKNKEVAFPRQVAMYLCCELTDISQDGLGKLLGGRDHSTVVYGRDKISERLKTDPELKLTIDTLTKKIKS